MNARPSDGQMQQLYSLIRMWWRSLNFTPVGLDVYYDDGPGKHVRITQNWSSWEREYVKTHSADFAEVRRALDVLCKAGITLVFNFDALSPIIRDGQKRRTT